MHTHTHTPTKTHNLIQSAERGIDVRIETGDVSAGRILRRRFAFSWFRIACLFKIFWFFKSFWVWQNLDVVNPGNRIFCHFAGFFLFFSCVLAFFLEFYHRSAAAVACVRERAWLSNLTRLYIAYTNRNAVKYIIDLVVEGIVASSQMRNSAGSWAWASFCSEVYFATALQVIVNWLAMIDVTVFNCVLRHLPRWYTWCGYRRAAWASLAGTFGFLGFL